MNQKRDKKKVETEMGKSSEANEVGEVEQMKESKKKWTRRFK